MRNRATCRLSVHVKNKEKRPKLGNLGLAFTVLIAAEHSLLLPWTTEGEKPILLLRQGSGLFIVFHAGKAL